jgi:hypothetical protein
VSRVRAPDHPPLKPLKFQRFKGFSFWGNLSANFCRNRGFPWNFNVFKASNFEETFCYSFAVQGIRPWSLKLQPIEISTFCSACCVQFDYILDFFDYTYELKALSRISFLSSFVRLS